jgi:hypothetical protein
MTTNDRGNRSPSRRALTVAGVATIAFSLIVSIGPAMAAAGGNGNSNGNGGNAGTVKIHDASTSLEAGLVGNEPQVCTFWVGFYSDGGEVGTWEMHNRPPTGNGALMSSGSYDTSGDGVDATSTLVFPDGHYSLDWEANGSNAKQKTFWVACDEETSGTDASPSEDPAPTDSESTPSDESTPSGESTPSDEAAPSGDETTPSDESTPSDEAVPSGDETTPSGDEQSTPSDEETTPSDDETVPSDDEQPAPTDEEPGNEQTPEQEVKAGNPDTDPQPVDGSVAGAGSGPSIPDTAMPGPAIPGNGGLSAILVAIGLLLIVIAHAGTRRERELPTA